MIRRRTAALTTTKAEPNEITKSMQDVNKPNVNKPFKFPLNKQV